MLFAFPFPAKVWHALPHWPGPRARGCSSLPVPSCFPSQTVIALFGAEIEQHLEPNKPQIGVCLVFNDVTGVHNGCCQSQWANWGRSGENQCKFRAFWLK